MIKREFEVVVTRTAYENATLKVKATSQDEAERKVGNLLDVAHRVDLDELSRHRDIKVVEVAATGDEESSWEII